MKGEYSNLCAKSVTQQRGISRLQYAALVNEWHDSRPGDDGGPWRRWMGVMAFFTDMKKPPKVESWYVYT